MTTLTVPSRFNGPVGTANGGYICGRIASLAAEPVAVRLLKPAPLDVALDAVETADGPELRLGTEAIARARREGVGTLAAPPAPTLERVMEASKRYAGLARHPAPTCFVCGPWRALDDGLRIFPGEIAAGAPRTVAAPWTPDPSLDAGDGTVSPEFVWAALDCPGYVAIAADMRAMLLGELTAEIDRRPRIGEQCIVVGWTLGSSGRKHEAGTALFSASGKPLARARAVWIEPRSS